MLLWACVYSSGGMSCGRVAILEMRSHFNWHTNDC